MFLLPAFVGGCLIVASCVERKIMKAPEFGIERKGYNRQEVDSYVDKIRAEYGRLSVLCKQYQTRMRVLAAGTQLNQVSQVSSDDVARVMFSAQAVARQTEEGARKNAELIVSQAHSQADQLMDDTKKKAREIAVHTQEQANKLMEEARRRAQETVAQAQHTANQIVVQARAQRMYGGAK
jgi:cell division septum initiation protein DivIVA